LNTFIVIQIVMSQERKLLHTDFGLLDISSFVNSIDEKQNKQCNGVQKNKKEHEVQENKKEHENVDHKKNKKNKKCKKYKSRQNKKKQTPQTKETNPAGCSADPNDNSSDDNEMIIEMCKINDSDDTSIEVMIETDETVLNKCIINDQTLKQESKRQYKLLPEQERIVIDNIIDNAKELLVYYKSVLSIFPDWLNIRFDENANHIHPNRHHIFQEIGYFIMTRIIDDTFIEIPHYRRGGIDNPFKRGLWHMASTINFTKIIEDTAAKIPEESINNNEIRDNSKNNDDSLFIRFLKLLDVFCLLTRKMTREEFEFTYKENFKCITNKLIDDNKSVPFWIYEQYGDYKITNIFAIISQYTPYASLILKDIDPFMVYFLLSESLETNIIAIGTIASPINTSKKEISFEKNSNTRKNIVTETANTQEAILSSIESVESNNIDNNQFERFNNRGNKFKNKFGKYQNNKFYNKYNKFNGYNGYNNYNNVHTNNRLLDHIFFQVDNRCNSHNNRPKISSADTHNNWRTK
jgi:hypothetical protein